MILVKMFCAFLCDNYFGFVKYEFILAGIVVWTGAGFM